MCRFGRWKVGTLNVRAGERKATRADRHASTSALRKAVGAMKTVAVHVGAPAWFTAFIISNTLVQVSAHRHAKSGRRKKSPQHRRSVLSKTGGGIGPDELIRGHHGMVSRWQMIHVVDAIHSSQSIVLCCEVMTTHGRSEVAKLRTLPTCQPAACPLGSVGGPAGEQEGGRVAGHQDLHRHEIVGGAPCPCSNEDECCSDSNISLNKLHPVGDRRARARGHNLSQLSLKRYRPLKEWPKARCPLGPCAASVR